MTDYYKVMGLARETTGEEIKKAYRSLALHIILTGTRAIPYVKIA